MGELVDPLENAWLVIQPSTTASKGCSYVNTNTTTPTVKVKIFACPDINTYYGECECGETLHSCWTYCPNCGRKLVWK